MRGYLSHQVIPAETDVHKYIMGTLEPEVCAEGPARTSKTMRNLLKVLALHCKYPGFRSCIVRANAVDLDDSVRAELTNKIFRYQLDDPRSQIKQQGGVTKFHHLYLNGGFMKLGGMSRPSSVLGGKYDLVLLSELSEFSEEQYQIIKTRCTGDAGTWKLEDGTICFQMLCDTNPDIHDHWMYQREIDGLMRFVKFDFKDNPYYFRQGRWSRQGKTSVEELDRGNTGIYHDRYFKGLRGAAEGLVFDMQPCHFMDELPWERKEDPIPFEEYTVNRAIDFGWSDPSVCLWIAQHQSTNDVIVIREFRKTNIDTIDLAANIKLFDIPGSRRTIVDVDNNIISLLRREGINAIPAKKGPNSIMAGVHLLQNSLARRKKQYEQEMLGEPVTIGGGLTFYTGLRCNSDLEIKRRKLPASVIIEMKNKIFGKDGKPEDGHDHGMDALRYWFLWKFGRAKLDLSMNSIPNSSALRRLERAA